MPPDVNTKPSHQKEDVMGKTANAAPSPFENLINARQAKEAMETYDSALQLRNASDVVLSLAERFLPVEQVEALKELLVDLYMARFS